LQVRRSRLLLGVAVTGLAVILGASASVLVPRASAREEREAAAAARAARARQGRIVLARIVERRDEAWRWQRLMGAPLHPYRESAERSPSLGYRRWVLRLWTRRAKLARRRARRPPHFAAWMCIHRHEGAWNDPDSPYYGGLQMDLQFQRAYGADLLRRKGTADRWTPLEQMWVAERAQARRGFRPWPNTARFCGLL